MRIKVINMGFGNMMWGNGMIWIVRGECGGMKGMIEDGREGGMVIDAT